MSELVEFDRDELLEGLSFQQEQFVLAYMANGGKVNAAAREAGYGAPEHVGSRVLAIPKVRAAIDGLRARRRLEIDMQLREKHLSPDRLIFLLSEMADFDPAELLDEHGKIDRSKLKAHARMLQSLEIDGNKTKLKGPDRVKAIDMLLNLMGLKKPEQQTNVQVNVGFGERMAARRARALGGRND